MKIREHLYGYIWTDYRANNCNTFLIRSEKSACLVDPGHRAFLPQLLQSMRNDGIPRELVTSVIVTHCHPDHLEGALDFRKQGAVLGIHRREEDFLKEIGPYFARMFGWAMPEISFDFYLEEGPLEIGGESFQVLETPGHSPGSISLFWEEPRALFSGDLVFAQGVGRTDFPGGDAKLLKASIRRCRGLKAALLLPGHGECLTTPDEVERNFELVERMYFSYL
jgi:glyoxylase-like metal-dependent hydrolase (beta-lactamase superfamily II)